MLAAGIALAPVVAGTSAAFAQAPPAVAPATAPLNIPRLIAQNLEQDIRLVETGRTQPERDEAARRLIARQSAEGRRAILAALLRRDNPGGQLAAARAIPDDPLPEARWIAPLGDLLGAAGQGGLERPLTEAATAALVTFRSGTAADTDAAFTRVRLFVSDPNGPASRSFAIRAMAASADYRVAELLISLVQDERSRVVAADTLTEMTLQPENGRDARAWATWWASQRAKTPDLFRGELLERQRRRRNANLSDVDALVGRLFQLVEEKSKPEALRRILDSTDAPIRAAGVRLSWQTFTAVGKLPDGVRERIRELLRDSSIEVRSEAARVLYNLNDRAAIESLLAQLTIDPDAGVRVAIMQALVPMKDLRAIPVLVQLLGDPSVRSATVAAETIAKLGDEIRKDSALRDSTAASLMQAVNNRGNQDADFKAACVEALVPLRRPENRNLFLGLIDARQASRTRKAALAGLGELRDPNLGNAVFGVVQNEQRDQSVRVAALDAMERLNAGGYIQNLLDLSRPNGDRDPDVRDRSRRVFEAYLPLASDQQIDGWAGEFLRAGEFARRIPVLKDKLRRLMDAADLKGAASIREAIGDAFLQLNQPQDAIPFFRQALDYQQNNKGTPQAQAGVRRLLMTALLMAKQYPDTARLAQEAMDRDELTQQDVISQIANEVDRLNSANQSRDAQRLAEEGLKVRKLDERYRTRLTRGLQAATQPPDRPR